MDELINNSSFVYKQISHFLNKSALRSVPWDLNWYQVVSYFQIKGRYGPDLDSLSEGFGSHVIGLLVDQEHRLHLFVNGVDQGVAAKEIPLKVFAIFDLYGQCQEVSFDFT